MTYLGHMILFLGIDPQRTQNLISSGSQFIKCIWHSKREHLGSGFEDQPSLHMVCIALSFHLPEAFQRLQSV